MATRGKAQVVSIAPEADVAILSAGHAADQVVWMDNNTGNWVSSSYYGHFPAWADHRNTYYNIDLRLQNESWQPANDRVGKFSYFVTGDARKPFAHRFKGSNRFTEFKTSAW